MLHNTTTPSVRVDARRERVSVDGVDVEPAPARHVPLNRAYFLA
jgi:urease alpha subunit